MILAQSFFEQVKLLLTVLPLINHYKDMALKGGTGINLFTYNMPRLSVDIDLTYLPIIDRPSTLLAIDAFFKDLEKKIVTFYPSITVTLNKTKEGLGKVLIVQSAHAQIKIEVNSIIRGTVEPPKLQILAPLAQDMFKCYVEIPVVSLADLYGGKICAALDRQHPRDLFDVKLLFETTGFDDRIRKSFLIYLLSHNRPISELLRPNLQDLTRVYEDNFKGMTFEHVALEELLDVRDQLIDLTNTTLTEDERRFLLSFKQAEPKWELLGIPNADQFQAIRWKLENIRKMDLKKRTLALQALEKKLRV